MFGRIGSLFTALAAAAALKTAPVAFRHPAGTPYTRPGWGRHSNQCTQRGPGISPALRGPHSERLVHVRERSGKHHWFTEGEWATDVSTLGERPGDVVERINGYGQVTNRARVPL